MKILLVGGSGQLGRTIQDVFKSFHPEWIVVAPDSMTLNLRMTEITSSLMREAMSSFDTIINCAAIHDAKEAEDLQRTWDVNVRGIGLLARYAPRVKFIQISTDNVFFNRGSFWWRPNELDEPNQSAANYSISKACAEDIVRAFYRFGKFSIVRVSALFGHYPCRGKDRPNFVEQVLAKIQSGETIELPDDQGCTPGYTIDVAHLIAGIILSEYNSGIIHAVPNQLPKDFSFYKFGRMVATVAGLDPELVVKKQGLSSGGVGRVNLTSIRHICLPSLEGAIERYLKLR